MAKIALIVGSVRMDRQGIKVARWVDEKLKNRNHIVLAPESASWTAMVIMDKPLAWVRPSRTDT